VAYARKYRRGRESLGDSPLSWHDFDYERWPNDAHSRTEEHPAGGSAILRERGYPEEMIRAILSHADYSGVPARDSARTHAVRFVDELAGFLTACSLVKPGKSIFEVEPDFGETQAEGQSLRPWRLIATTSARAPKEFGRSHRGAHRLLHRRHARHCGMPWASSARPTAQ